MSDQDPYETKAIAQLNRETARTPVVRSPWTADQIEAVSIPAGKSEVLIAITVPLPRTFTGDVILESSDNCSFLARVTSVSAFRAFLVFR